MKKLPICLVIASLLLSACAPVAAPSAPTVEVAAEVTTAVVTPVATAKVTATPAPAETPVPATEAPVEKPKADPIPVKDIDENSGADSYANAGDNAESRYFKNPDYYNLTNDDQLTILSHYKTMQQSCEWSCGNAMTLMVLNHLGLSVSDEMTLARAMGSSTDSATPGSEPGSANKFPDYGTNVRQLYDYFSKLDGVKIVETNYKPEVASGDLLTEKDGVSENKVGNVRPVFSSGSLYTSSNDPEGTDYVEDAKDSYFVKWLLGHLNANRPVMVQWCDWDGHWQAIIGYDNNGTPGIGDDVLIMADSYDTRDHWQDGYYVVPLERWFYMWEDLNVAPKPWQIQPYIVVEAK